MPTLRTKYIGEVNYTEDSLLTFPSGLVGFESHRSFVFITKADAAPLVFMQSVDDRELCFIVLPILTIDANYHLQMSDDEREQIGLAPGRSSRIGDDVFCGALLCAGSGAPPTVNLLSPLVVNLSNRLGLQVIQSASGYSHRHPLLNGCVPCS